MNFRPLVFSFLAMLLSIVILLLSNFHIVVVSVLLALSILSIFIFIFKRNLTKYIVVPIFVLVGLVCSTFNMYLIKSGSASFSKGSVTGRVVSVRDYGVVITDAKAGNIQINGNIMIYTNEQFNIGDIIASYTDISPIDYDINNGYINSLYDDNIYHQSNGDFTKVDSTKLSVSEKVKLQTKMLYSKFMRADSSAIAYGMLFGDTSLFSDNLKGSLSTTGLNHIFAVSGLHIGFLTAIVMWINRKLKIKRLLNVLITFAVLVVYNALCGYSPSMIRATIMAVVMIIGRELGLKNDAFSRLSLAGILILLFKPLSVGTISFQMSFLAVFGLIAFGNVISEKLTRIPKFFSSLIGASLGVNFAIFPLISYHFNTFSLLFLPVNFVILPILPLIYAFSLMLTVVNLIFTNVGFVIAIDYLLAPIKLVTLVTTELGFSVLNVAFNRAALCLYLVGEYVISPFVFIKKRSKALIFSFLLILSLIFIIIGIY